MVRAIRADGLQRQVGRFLLGQPRKGTATVATRIVTTSRVVRTVPVRIRITRTTRITRTR